MALIISGFPGIGKTHLFNSTNYNVLDSDSSQFDKSHFPGNYIKHIQDNIDKQHIILVSSHKMVRDALNANNIRYTLVHPGRNLLHEYLSRYKARGSSEEFCKLIEQNWYNWIDEIIQDKSIKSRYVLSRGEYLSDVIEDLLTVED